MKNIIFIFSLPRSGSTLLQRMLAAHPQISAHAEPWLLLPLVYSLRETGIYAEYHHGHAVKGIHSFLKEMPQQADDFYKGVGRMVYELYAKAAHKDSVYFLDKTPRYYLILQEIRRMFPDAKFIFLFRNPLQVYASMLETWYNGRLLFHGSHMDLFRGPKLLAEGFRDMQSISMGVDFENLVNDSENTVRKILGYLDLEFDSACVKNFHQIQFSGSLGDPSGSIRYKSVNNEPLAKWKTAINTVIKKRYANRFLSFIGEDDLNTLGYSKTALQKSIRGLRVKKFGLVDFACLTTSGLIRTMEPFIFMGKYKQKKRDGFPFAVNR